jgi:uncharacterized protein (UPF0335 family)
MSNIQDKRLLSFIERLENLQAQKDEIAADMKDVRQEAKSAGYDVPTINRILKMRKLSDQERAEQEALRDTYLANIGMLAGTPLGNSGLERATRGAEGGGKSKPPRGGAKKVDVVTADLPPPHDPETGEIIEALREPMRAETGIAPDGKPMTTERLEPEWTDPDIRVSERVVGALDAVRRMMQGPVTA